MSSSPRAAQIAQIIQQRQPLVQHIEQVESNLKALASALQQLDKQKSQLLQKVNDDSVAQKLEDLNFWRLISDINAEIGALSKLKIRFGRKTLNIGVVGKAKQGKSRLLQSISGLSASEIPDGSHSHCTGVRSTVYHKDIPEPYGEVWFHTEQTLLGDVIGEYYRELGLGLIPPSLDEFVNNPLPPLPSLPDHRLPKAKAKYNHLQEKYHGSLNKYRHLLNRSSPQQIRKEEIREYVAQDTPNGEREFFNYLAVREACIMCQFPNSDVGNIALIDMPGLGDTGVGDELRMVEILGKDVDAVLLMRKGLPLGDFLGTEDLDLYGLAKSALTVLPIELWSFMIFNRTEQSSTTSDNLQACTTLSEALLNSEIKVTNSFIVNCAKPEEVDQNLLEPILQYLASNISQLDQQYARTQQDQLKRLQKSVSLELLKAKDILGVEGKNDNSFPLFQKLFNQLWQDLTVGLQKLLSELSGQRNIQDSDFKAQVKAALQSAQEDTGIPTLEEIEVKRLVVGAYGIAYEMFLHEIRAHLSQHFLILDDGLKRSLDQTKEAVAEVLIDQGRLGSVTEARGVEFLKDMTQQIPSSLQQVKLGFQVLTDFELSYRGLIQHRIRKHLDGLTPDLCTLRLSQSPSDDQILQNLKTLHEEAIYHCEDALEEIFSEPSQAAYAIVEEFIDRVLRAKGAKDEWQILIEELRSEIWAEEFEQLGGRTRIRRTWLSAVESAEVANHSIKFQFDA